MVVQPLMESAAVALSWDAHLIRRLQERLLTWYRGVARDLPWRRTRDPYAIWVSEVMLQQTQVARVVPFYERWMARFPTVMHLAKASLDDVLKLWEGLGYYARARKLHEAARLVVEEHGGQLPASAEALMALPGIGPYTAGAIASIAFGQRAVALDGNGRRVLARLLALDEPINTSRGEHLLREAADRLLPDAEEAGAWNQALMELGATICRPRAPRCERCPWHDECGARRQGRQHELPRRVPRRPRPHYQVAAGLIWNGQGELLIAKRPPGKMLGGLWEFPGGKCRPDETLEACLRRELHEELGIEVAVGTLAARVEHGYSHFSITLHAFHCRHIGGTPQALHVAEWRWVHPEALHRFAWSAADLKVIEHVLGTGKKLADSHEGSPRPP
ncbi:MAG: A/G-specific adenine glycosylase [Ardenticatenia bacterium]|nr:A/G-specific adenine glycosylase [Ardenticatenia bacterium]